MGKARALRWERRPEARPDEILDAALALFRERGYRATRLGEVAERAGVSKPTLYYYFRNKDELLAEAVLRRLRATMAPLEALASQAAPASTRLRLVLRKLWDAYRTPEVAQGFRMVLGELATEAPALFGLWVSEGLMHRWELVERLVEEGKGLGEFRPDADAKVAARVIVAALTLQAALRTRVDVDEPDPVDPDRFFDSAVEQFIHGLHPWNGR